MDQGNGRIKTFVQVASSVFAVIQNFQARSVAKKFFFLLPTF